MPNYLRKIVSRPLGGGEDQTWDDAPMSDEDLWAHLPELGAPMLVAYEDSYSGWYLAFTNGGETQVIFLEPNPLLDPDAPLRIPAELVDKVAPDVALAFGDDVADITMLLSGREELYVNGRDLVDAAAWKRVLAALAKTTQTPMIFVDRTDGRRYVWRKQKSKLVSHSPEPAECWKALRKLVAHDDPEQLFREMYFR